MPPRPADFDLNRSLWVEGHEGYVPEPALAADTTSDVVIVGGGFTGVSTAWHLSERYRDRRIVLLEARTLANGASGRNGGQMLHWINGVGYDDPELVRRVYAVTDRGIQWIVRTIEQHRLPVRYRVDGCWEFQTDARRAEEAAAHVERLVELGLPMAFHSGEELRRHVRMEGVQGGIFDPRTGLLNGADFVRALKPLLLRRGVEIFEETMVTRIEEGPTHVVHTPGGRVRAPALVLATGGYSGRLGYFKNQVLPMHSHMIATAPRTVAEWEELGWGLGGAFCDDLDRIAFGGLAPGGSFVFGGGSNAAYAYRYGGRTAEAPEQAASGFAAVEARLHAYFPRLADLAPVTHRWSGTLGITFDRQCSIGIRGQHRNVYYATGFSGHGVALANLAGEVIADLYSDHHEPWKDLPFYQKRLLWIPPEPVRWLGYQVVTGLTGRSPRRRG